ncbi:hypothetical protein P872_17935 [Rhodonellum psychrophilum GCM71 = DSM 17998]|uniref:Uncharacterized protein n=1 Tax=Rhodonellum psychrophilum GCM71 = DSM 17998 TaxID=1123057 RepID=U5BXV6_9BACT|nr:hypothetical protein P872_17935 [Rhodonellum psychrophilum GCM71 = DSM 17998]
MAKNIQVGLLKKIQICLKIKQAISKETIPFFLGYRLDFILKNRLSVIYQ